MVEGNQKKRHHYVPATYLDQFADTRGRIFAYRKDGPPPPLHVRPREIAFERYYYSQPLPEGGRDNNRLEDFFSEVETHWPILVDKIISRQDIRDLHEVLFNFVSLLRVRVPAARDPAELLLARIARNQMQQMYRRGELPPLPANLTLEDVEVAIDPHQSIHAMAVMLQGMAELWNYVGLEIVHNKTIEPFITSDNPVVYFDPDVPEQEMLPYTVRPPRRRVELLMPITPAVMLRGSTDIQVVNPGVALRHVEMNDRDGVARVNRHIARFGYRFVFSNNFGLESFVSKFSKQSPTVHFRTASVEELGVLNVSQMVFGARPKKPKWQPLWTQMADG